jgi:hypothetical protein
VVLCALENEMSSQYLVLSFLSMHNQECFACVLDLFDYCFVLLHHVLIPSSRKMSSEMLCNFLANQNSDVKEINDCVSSSLPVFIQFEVRNTAIVLTK